MAATVSSVWAKPGAWALDSEQHEDELNNNNNNQIIPQQPKSQPPTTDFPSLAAAATTKPKKKNKPKTLSFAEFTTYSPPAPKPTSEPKGLTQDEILMLPTGPRERTADELDKNRLGGGFRNYGGDRDRGRVSGSDNRRENSNRERVDLGPSRADEVDDWSKTKKFTAFGPGDRGERRERGGFFNSSRADEVDNWAVNKGSVGFSDGPRRERRMGFDSYSNGSGSESDNWLKKKEERVGNGVERDTWGRRESNGPGNGRPKLNLQPRTLPVVKSEGDNGGQSVTPTEGKVKGASPFGEARPREEVLKGKGKDWKEIDEKLEAVKIKDVSSNGEKSEGFGWRRGFGVGDEKSVKTWRKPESGDAVASPTESSTDPAENNTNAAESIAESAESTEKVPEEK